jgi:hypothetical protein
VACYNIKPEFGIRNRAHFNENTPSGVIYPFKNIIFSNLFFIGDKP